MDKQNADRILTEYLQKIYGFALSKTGDSYEAEELASDITYEVYLSLLRDGMIYNVNAYIRRISSYVFARWVEKKRRARERGGVSVDEVMEQVAKTGAKMPLALIDTEVAERAERAAHEDSLRLLRREIAYLGETQRKIVVAHYYGGQSVKEIAEGMDIPVGTVKWHLFDARKTIKEGMNMERNKGTLGINPIRLCSMGHNGRPGTTGDTAAHLNTVLAQNIAYAAYLSPKTEAEIAEELGITPVFIADIVADLEEYGFMTRVEGGKLRTDIVISRSTKEVDEAIHALKTEAADKLCKRFMPVWLKNMDGYYERNKDSIYVPEGDLNLWRWSAFMWGRQDLPAMDTQIDQDILNRYFIQRPDGGCYIAYADVDDDYTVDYDGTYLWACGHMTRRSDRYENLSSVQLNTAYDTRPNGWEDNLYTDYDILYEFITGQLPETQPNLVRYQRLFNRGLVVRRESGISVNVPVVKSDLPAFDLFEGIDMKELNAIYTDCSARIADLQDPLYPPHMREYNRARLLAYGTNLDMYIYRWMLDNGVLTLPEDDRRGGIMTVVFAEKLPKA